MFGLFVVIQKQNDGIGIIGITGNYSICRYTILELEPNQLRYQSVQDGKNTLIVILTFYKNRDIRDGQTTQIAEVSDTFNVQIARLQIEFMLFVLIQDKEYLRWEELPRILVQSLNYQYLQHYSMNFTQIL